MVFLYALLLIMVSKVALSLEEGANRNQEYIVPSMKLSDLEEVRDYNILHEALTTTGILAITEIGVDFSKWRESALHGFCKCVPHSEFSRIENSDSFVLEDELTTRTSIATATSLNGVPLALSKDIDSVCGYRQRESMEKLRDFVHHASVEFVNALDRLISPSSSISLSRSSTLLESQSGELFLTVDSIIKNSNHLEHFHSYKKGKITDRHVPVKDVLSTHTDAGLFLSFIPAFSCDQDDNDEEDSSLKVLTNGILKEAIFPRNSIVIMLGIGAEQWLQNMPFQLRATKHAVQMKEGTSRVWYGMMHLVPENAIIQTFPTKATFADMRQSMLLRSQNKTYSESIIDTNEEDISIGCGFAPISKPEKQVTPTARSITQRRRLVHVDPSACNNGTNFYCWMVCTSIPDVENAAAFIEQGKSLYCADKNKIDSGLKTATENCQSRSGIPGGAMNSNCVGMWHSSGVGIPSQKVKIPENRRFVSNLSIQEETSKEEYCYSGTSMYMNGFQWKGIYCVIYLFPSWVLNTQWKMILAFSGTFFISIGLEGIITGRRIVLPIIKGKNTRLVVSTITYGIQLTLGYLIMLIVMTYSLPLFFSVILGLMAGHFLFHLSTNSDPVVGEGATPCCQNHVSGPKEHHSSPDKNFPDVIKGKTGMSSETYSSIDSLTEAPDSKSCECNKSNSDTLSTCCEKEVNEKKNIITTPTETDFLFELSKISNGYKTCECSESSDEIPTVTLNNDLNGNSNIKTSSCCDKETNEKENIRFHFEKDIESSPTQTLSNCCEVKF